MNTLRAILFDFDGVIADTEPLHFAGLRRTLADIGITLTEPDYYANYLGFDDRGCFLAVLQANGRPVTPSILHDLMAKKAVAYLASVRDHLVIFPGVREFVREAAARYPLAIASGEFFSFLGPSGCGKTTLLRLIAGFAQAQTGQVLLDGVDVAGLPPWRRDVGMVFQSYALWPHMTVAKNVAFGLEERHLPRAGIDRRVAQMEAGYGGARRTLSTAFNPSTRDANNNRVIMNGVIQDGQGGSQINVNANGQTSGADFFRSGADSFTAGALTASSTAIGNQINVNVNGSWNTVVLDSTQINNAPINATITVTGRNTTGQ